MNGYEDSLANGALNNIYYEGMRRAGVDVDYRDCVVMGTVTKMILAGTASQVIDSVETLCVDAGMPVNLDDIGRVDENQLRKAADYTWKNGVRCHEIKDDVTAEEVYEAMLDADVLGKYAKLRARW